VSFDADGLHIEVGVGLKTEVGLSTPAPPHFIHWLTATEMQT